MVKSSYYKKSSKRKSSFKRRKSYSSRRKSKYSRPDGYHSEKIVYRQYLSANSAGSGSGQAVFYATWLKALANAGSAGRSQSCAANVNTDKQFMQCATMYREYRITGVQFKYTPVHYNDSAFYQMELTSGSKQYTSDQPVVPTAQDIQGAFDFKTHNSARSFTRYYKIGKWAKSKNIGWQTCQDILQNPPQNVEPYDMVTAFRCTHNPQSYDGLKIGSLDVTYYVKFRQRTSAAYQG